MFACRSATAFRARNYLGFPVPDGVPEEIPGELKAGLGGKGASITQTAYQPWVWLSRLWLHRMQLRSV